VECNFLGGEIVVDQNSDFSARSIAYISVFFENIEVKKCGIAFVLKLVSCRHMIVGLWSLIISWSSSNLL